MPAVESAIAQRITDNGTILGLSFEAELRGFEPYSECVTLIERECTISDEGARCETPDLPYIMTVSYYQYCPVDRHSSGSLTINTVPK